MTTPSHISHANMDKCFLLAWRNADEFFNGYGQFYSGPTRSEHFVPIKIEIPVWIDPANATFQFDFWSGSLVTLTPGRPPVQSGNGNIRIWTKDGNNPRNGNDIKLYGNLITDGAIYTASQLGFTDTERTITLYVEGHSLGSNTITIAMDYNYGSQTIHVDDTVKYEVQESHWEVTRNSAQTTAIAVSGTGDTILNLAVEIGLEPNEFLNWLTVNTPTLRLEDNTEVPVEELTIGSKLAGGQVVRVPNTIYMAWFGEMTLLGIPLGQVYMSWFDNQSRLASLGFKVETFDNDTYSKFDAGKAKQDFYCDIQSLSTQKELHGMYFMGHGTPTTINSEDTRVYTQGPKWNILYGNVKDVFDPYSHIKDWTIGSALQYHLGALLIQACDSDGGDIRKLVSLNGIFSGKTGTYWPSPENLAMYWGRVIVNLPFGGTGYQYGGKQKTNTF